MKRLLIGLCCALGISTWAFGDSSFVAPPSPGQIPGTTTNDNASAGNVGQFVVASTAETNLAASTSTVTITIASPGGMTWGTTIPYVKDPNGIATCAVINFTTSGALPTPLVAGTNYYVIGNSISGNTAQLATTVDNCIAGTAINTSGSQSGTHTGVPAAILSTGVVVDLAAFALTAGDWDVSGSATFLPAATTSVNSMSISINTVSATANFVPTSRAQVVDAAAVLNNNTYLPVGPYRQLLASTTTVRCVTSGTFAISTMSVYGGCRARRPR